MVSATSLLSFFFLSPIPLSRNTELRMHYSQVSHFHDSHSTIKQCIAALLHTIDVCVRILKLACTYCNRKQQNGVGMALNEATLPLILYREIKTIDHVIVRTSCHISIPCFITFSASAIPTPFFIFNVFIIQIVICQCTYIYTIHNDVYHNYIAIGLN